MGKTMLSKTISGGLEMTIKVTKIGPRISFGGTIIGTIVPVFCSASKTPLL